MNHWRAIAVSLVLFLAVLLSHRATSGEQAQTPAYFGEFSTHLSLLKEIRDETRALRADMRAMGGGGSLPGMGRDAIVKARCASCHAAGAAEEKGDGFVLIDREGKIVELSERDSKRLNKKIDKNEMPPGGGLSDTEKRAIKSQPLKGQP